MTRTPLMCRSVALAAVTLMAVTLAAAPSSMALQVSAAEGGVAPDPFGFYTPVLVVVDTSGSMSEVVDNAAKTRRMDAAQGAVLDLISAMGTGQQFGLIAYPGEGSMVDDQGCNVGQTRVRLGPLDVPAAAAEIRRLEPDGETPTGPAISNAAQVLRSTYGDRAGGVIVVVSDGEANCGPPPCDVARQVRASGLDVQFNAVGLNLTEDEAEQLQCVAAVGGGRYIDVVDGTDPSDAIAQAARASLDLDIAAPDTLAVVTGDGAGGAEISVTVRSLGRVPAANVRVALSVTRGDGGRVTVPRPIRYLGNVADGDSETVEFTIRPDDDAGVGSARVRVQALADNAAPAAWAQTVSIVDTLAVERLGGVLSGTSSVIVLGDSYSSGEGAAPYLPGTDRETKTDNTCHRSNNTYAAQLWGSENARIIACSGAVTADFTRRQVAGARVVPQLEALREAVLTDAPDAVVISVGGNDASFADIATACVTSPGCSLQPTVIGGYRRPPSLVLLPWTTTDMLVRANGVEGDVRRTLGLVDAAVNDAVAVDARGGNTIPIVVVPYPRIIPPAIRDNKLPDGCALLVSGSELVELNQYIDALNNSVAIASYYWRGQGRPVYVATDVVESFQPDHTLCEGTLSYANPVSTPRVESLHPNARGYAAMARAIASWSVTRAASPIAVRGEPTWSPDVIEDPVAPLRPRPQFLAPLRTFASAGSAAYVDVRGYAPDAQVVTRLYSSPRTVASWTADENGRVRGWIRLPEDTPQGTHHLASFGPDPQGIQTVQASTVHVLPQGGAWLIVAGCVGILLVLVAAGMLLITGRRGAGQISDGGNGR